MSDYKEKVNLSDLHEEWLLNMENSIWGRQEISVISKIEGLGLQMF